MAVDRWSLQVATILCRREECTGSDVLRPPQPISPLGVRQDRVRRRGIMRGRDACHSSGREFAEPAGGTHIVNC
eukprot:3009670-Heterocapsa_arctica.AAC.1